MVPSLRSEGKISNIIYYTISPFLAHCCDLWGAVYLLLLTFLKKVQHLNFDYIFQFSQNSVPSFILPTLLGYLKNPYLPVSFFNTRRRLCQLFFNSLKLFSYLALIQFTALMTFLPSWLSHLQYIPYHGHGLKPTSLTPLPHRESTQSIGPR